MLFIDKLHISQSQQLKKQPPTVSKCVHYLSIGTFDVPKYPLHGTKKGMATELLVYGASRQGALPHAEQHMGALRRDRGEDTSAWAKLLSLGLSLLTFISNRTHFRSLLSRSL